MDATKPAALSEAASPLGARAESPEVAALVERAKAGDAEAFSDLMLLYERRIIAIGIQMGLTRDDAMDACQDSFIKVFRYIHRFRSGESFFKWLYRIAIHSVYDHLRKSRNPGVVSIEDLDPAVAGRLTDGTPAADRSIASAQLAGALMAGVGELSRQERIVFVLRDLQEMSTVEIGTILRLSQVTVRRHCMSARQKLRRRLFGRDH